MVILFLSREKCHGQFQIAQPVFFLVFLTVYLSGNGFLYFATFTSREGFLDLGGLLAELSSWITSVSELGLNVFGSDQLQFMSTNFRYPLSTSGISILRLSKQIHPPILFFYLLFLDDQNLFCHLLEVGNYRKTFAEVLTVFKIPFIDRYHSFFLPMTISMSW